MNLSINCINRFAEYYCNRLLDRRINYYIHDEGNHSRANTVHSGIIWSREAVEQLNSIDFKDSINHDLNHLILLITYVDILLEATDQIYRVLYKQTKPMPLSTDLVFFLNRPELYASLDDRQYFKEIRALLSAHPINLKEPGTNEKRFADTPIGYNPITDFKSYHKIEGDYDFSSRLWTATRHDENTIHFPIRIIEIEKFAEMLVGRYTSFLQRLRDIVYKRI